MTEDQYLKSRVEAQERWYDRKSQSNQRWHKWITTLQFTAAAIIPFIAGNSSQIPYFEWLVGALGVLIAVASAIASMNKFHENWIQYRTTCETLRHEKFLYLTGVSPYNSDTAFALLVENIEGIVSRENTKWAQYAAKAQRTKPAP